MNSFGPRWLLSPTRRKSFAAINWKSTLSKSVNGGFQRTPEFGLLVDIDGVIVRGNKLIPGSKEAFHKFLTVDGEFVVPTIFLTNGGNTLRANKAKSLSELLGVDIKENQVVLAHSPLKSMTSWHSKHVLVCGQGPQEEIARDLGFTRVTTIEALRDAFPLHDIMDAKRRASASAPNPLAEHFPPIEAVVLMGDPIRWESHLQLIVDLLLTNGHPSRPLACLPRPHLPVIACNADLLWAAQAPLPRMGHGSFLHVLEALYLKITGHPLIYDAVLGKPSPLTYQHAERVVIEESRQIFPSASKTVETRMPLKTLYGIGDNPETDICGANAYDALLAVGRGLPGGEALACRSVLVRSGVYQEGNGTGKRTHQHASFMVIADMCGAELEVNDFYQAVETILVREGLL